MIDVFLILCIVALLLAARSDYNNPPPSYP